MNVWIILVSKRPSIDKQKEVNVIVNSAQICVGMFEVKNYKRSPHDFLYPNKPHLPLVCVKSLNRKKNVTFLIYICYVTCKFITIDVLLYILGSINTNLLVRKPVNRQMPYFNTYLFIYYLLFYLCMTFFSELARTIKRSGRFGFVVITQTFLNFFFNKSITAIRCNKCFHPRCSERFYLYLRLSPCCSQRTYIMNLNKSFQDHST